MNRRTITDIAIIAGVAIVFAAFVIPVMLIDWRHADKALGRKWRNHGD